MVRTQSTLGPDLSREVPEASFVTELSPVVASGPCAWPLGSRPSTVDFDNSTRAVLFVRVGPRGVSPVAGGSGPIALQKREIVPNGYVFEWGYLYFSYSSNSPLLPICSAEEIL
jgi:hypothetical protein